MRRLGGGCDEVAHRGEGLPEGGKVALPLEREGPYNPYSTSRLPYFVRCIAGSMVAEKVVAVGRWAEIPEHHPFLAIEKMMKVESQQQHCVLGARCQREEKLYLRA